MSSDDLNLRIAKAKGWEPIELAPDYTVAGPASEGLVEELCQDGPLIMKWLNRTWTIEYGLKGNWEWLSNQPSRYVAIARVWLAVFEGVKHE